jgi:alpha-amylase
MEKIVQKYMETGYPNTTYFDLTKHVSDPIVTIKDGWDEFRCQMGFGVGAKIKGDLLAEEFR